MTRYIQPELTGVSYDAAFFPLLAGGEACIRGVSYPTTFPGGDGRPRPLFSGGVLSFTEIENIAVEMAAFIHDRHRGGRILIVELLEGAAPFSRMLCSCLAKENQKQGRGSASLDYKLASLKVSSYHDGSTGGMHQIVRPLQGDNGLEIKGLTDYDGVLIVDDLIDKGATFAWLFEEYLPPLKPAAAEAYFMLDKRVARSQQVNQLQERLNPLCGRIVPDEWLVGFGLDISLPGATGQADLHLFRGHLPGGIYAFNSALEKCLAAEYRTRPEGVAEVLNVYLSRL